MVDDRSWLDDAAMDVRESEGEGDAYGEAEETVGGGAWLDAAARASAMPTRKAR